MAMTRRAYARTGRRFAGKTKAPVYPFTITSISPSSISTGVSPVVVNLVTVGVPPTAIAYIDGVAATTVVNSAVSVDVTVPAANIADPGSVSIRLVDVTGNSNSRSLTITATTASLASVTPSRYDLSFPATTRTFTLNGTGFYSNNLFTYITVDGNAVPFTRVNSATITVDLSDGVARTYTFQVINNPPGGGSSVTRTADINYTVPTIASSSPPSSALAPSGVSITVTGTNYFPASVITVDGVDITTTYVNATTLTGFIPGSVANVTGVKVLRVRNPTTAGGGGVSVSSVNFQVGFPLPVLDSISPAKLSVNAGATTITLNGSLMTTSTVARVDTVNQTTNTAGQPSSCSFSYTPSALGEFNIDCTNPTTGGGGGTSMAQVLAIVPVVSSMTPNTGIQYDPPTVGSTVTGVGFVSGCVVEINGIDCPTTFVNSTTLTITIPGTVSINPGAQTVRVKRATGQPTSTTSTTYTLTAYDPLVTATGNYASYDADHVVMDTPSNPGDVIRISDIVGGVGSFFNTANVAQNPPLIASDSSLNNYASISYDGVNEFSGSTSSASPLITSLFPAGDLSIAFVFRVDLVTVDDATNPYANNHVFGSDSNPGIRCGFYVRKGGGSGAAGSTATVGFWIYDGAFKKVEISGYTVGSWTYAIVTYVGTTLNISLKGSALVTTTSVNHPTATIQRSAVGRCATVSPFTKFRFRAMIFGTWVANDIARFQNYCLYRLGIT